MKIRRLRVDGFGRLRGEIRLAPDRCNLLLAPNESGKSTLVAAILAGLYGFPEERRSRHNPVPWREAYRPWRGGPFAVAIEFSLGEESWEIRRDFALDRVELFEGRTGKDVADQYRAERGRHEILERLLGLEREDFARSALVLQEEIQEVRDGAGLTLRLQKFATSVGGDISAGEAVACLRDALLRYEGTQLAGRGKVETEVRRLDEALEQNRSRLEALASSQAEAEAALTILGALDGQEAVLAAALHRLDYLRTRAVVGEIETQIAMEERAAQRLQALTLERQQLAERRGFPLESLHELNELKGKGVEIAGRLQAARAALASEVEEALAGVRARLTTLAPALGLPAAATERLTALHLRLQELPRQRRGVQVRLRAERQALHTAGVDVTSAASTRARFGALSPADRRFLETYRERRLECEARRRDLDALPLPEAEPPTAAAAPFARTAFTLSGALLIVGGLVAWPLLHSLLVSGLLAGAGLVALALAATSSPAAAPAVTVEHPERAAVEGEIEALRQRAEALARTFGLPDPAALIESFRAGVDLGLATAQLQRHQEELGRCDEKLASAREEALALLRDAGRDARLRGVRRRLDALRQDLEEGRRLRDREAGLAARAEAGRAEASELENRGEAVRARMAGILEAAGLASTPGDDEEVARFAAAAEEAQRLRTLEVELIPEAETAVRPARWLSERRAERQTVEELLAKIKGQRPLDPCPEPEHSSNHYVAEFKRTDEELRQTQRQRRETLARAGDLLRQFREEGPRLQEERERLEAARRRAERFARAVGLAAELLTGISRESYEEWATALNERSNRALGYLNPEYRDLRFDTDLSFTLQEVATGRRLTRDQVDACLSAGARDQVYLAVRLAVSDYFSAGRLRLPLILDDVLATADDERFDRALAYLAEKVSRRHQILILSCHNERHRRWRERHPDLFDARVFPVTIPALQEREA